MTVLLIIVTVLCIILLLPLRIKGKYGDGAWSVAVYYTFFRVFHKESAEKTEPETPPQPNPAADTPPPPAPAPQHDSPPKKPKKPKKPKDSAKPEALPAEPLPLDDSDLPNLDEIAEGPAPAPEKPKKKRGIKAFIERLKPHSLSDILGLAKDGTASLSPALRLLLRHLHFRHVKVYLAVASDDPANTAQLYGKICAAVYNLLSRLQCVLDIETDEMRILADFFNDKSTFRAELELRCSPAALICTALSLGIRFLWRSWRRFRREDKEKARYEKESAPLPSAN